MGIAITYSGPLEASRFTKVGMCFASMPSEGSANLRLKEIARLNANHTTSITLSATPTVENRLRACFHHGEPSLGS